MEMRPQPIGLAGQTVLAIIPSILTQLIAFYRIKRIKQGGAVIVLSTVLVSTGLQFLIGFPWGIIGVLTFTATVSVHYVRKWTKEYNARLGSQIADVG